MSTFATALAQVDLDLNQKGPEDLQQLIRIFGVLLGVGFIVGIAGHVVKSRTLVIIGVGLVFIATFVFLLAVGSYG